MLLALRLKNAAASAGGPILRVLLLLLGLAGAARAQDSTLTRLIRQHQYPLVAAGGQFSGAGWDKLQKSIQQSQFVLVGEAHGTAQIPVFTAAVAQVFKPAAFVAEIDPYVAADLTALAAQPGPPTAYLQQYPEALCFYNWAEEYELIRTLRAQQVQVVGLDQVFIMNTGRIYTLLAEQAKGKAAKAYLQRRAAFYRAQGLALAPVSDTKTSMSEQTPSSVDSLVAITQKEGPAVRQMVQDYVASYQIYRTYDTHTLLPSGLSGHQARLNLMRRNLLRFVQERPNPAAPLPKMLFKFGTNHLGRGVSTASFGEFYDVGSLALNLAEAQGQQSLHLMVVGKQGKQANGSNQADRSKNEAPLTPADNAYLKPFFDQTTGPTWNVVDLRPARRAVTAGKLVVGQKMQRVLLGFDYLIIIPETTASRTY